MARLMASNLKQLYEFDGFRLDAQNHSLWRGGELVSISPKALETLILLVTRRDEVVSREDLLAHVWKDTFVEEGNINYTVSLLRKVLGDKKFIQTIPRRGYRFVADVKQFDEDGADKGGEVSPIQPALEIAEPLPRAPAVTTGGRENKRRPVFFSAAFAGVLLLILLAFSWRGGSAGEEIKANSPTPGAAHSEAARESLQAYKRGRMILDDRDVRNREERALEEFRRAVTLDPTSALAYAGLAEGLLSKAHSMPEGQSAKVYAQAKAAAGRAFSLDENLLEAHLARGWVRRNGYWDWEGAEQDFRRAVELNPNSAVAHYRYSQLLANLGRRAEARAEYDKAAALDPLSETIISGHFPLLESAGEYDLALRLAAEYVQLNSENPMARRALATFQYHTGDYLKVIENGELVLANAGNKKPFAWLSLLAAAYLKTGQTSKAGEALRELEAQSLTDKRALYSLAMNYAELERREEAIAALERCYEIHEQRMMWLAAEPRFANLRSEPRFRELVAKMRLN